MSSLFSSFGGGGDKKKKSKHKHKHKSKKRKRPADDNFINLEGTRSLAQPGELLDDTSLLVQQPQQASLALLLASKPASTSASGTPITNNNNNFAAAAGGNNSSSHGHHDAEQQEGASQDLTFQFDFANDPVLLSPTQYNLQQQQEKEQQKQQAQEEANVDNGENRGTEHDSESNHNGATAGEGETTPIQSQAEVQTTPVGATHTDPPPIPQEAMAEAEEELLLQEEEYFFTPTEGPDPQQQEPQERYRQSPLTPQKVLQRAEEQQQQLQLLQQEQHHTQQLLQEQQPQSPPTTSWQKQLQTANPSWLANVASPPPALEMTQKAKQQMSEEKRKELLELETQNMRNRFEADMIAANLASRQAPQQQQQAVNSTVAASSSSVSPVATASALAASLVIDNVLAQQQRTFAESTGMNDRQQQQQQPNTENATAARRKDFISAIRQLFEESSSTGINSSQFIAKFQERYKVPFNDNTKAFIKSQLRDLVLLRNDRLSSGKPPQLEQVANSTAAASASVTHENRSPDSNDRNETSIQHAEAAATPSTPTAANAATADAAPATTATQQPSSHNHNTKMSPSSSSMQQHNNNNTTAASSSLRPQQQPRAVSSAPIDNRNTTSNSSSSNNTRGNSSVASSRRTSVVANNQPAEIIDLADDTSSEEEDEQHQGEEDRMATNDTGAATNSNARTATTAATSPVASNSGSAERMSNSSASGEKEAFSTDDAVAAKSNRTEANAATTTTAATGDTKAATTVTSAANPSASATESRHKFGTWEAYFHDDDDKDDKGDGADQDSCTPWEESEVLEQIQRSIFWQQEKEPLGTIEQHITEQRESGSESPSQSQTPPPQQQQQQQTVDDVDGRQENQRLNRERGQDMRLIAIEKEQQQQRPKEQQNSLRQHGRMEPSHEDSATAITPDGARDAGNSSSDSSKEPSSTMKHRKAGSAEKWPRHSVQLQTGAGSEAPSPPAHVEHKTAEHNKSSTSAITPVPPARSSAANYYKRESRAQGTSKDDKATDNAGGGSSQSPSQEAFDFLKEKGLINLQSNCPRCAKPLELRYDAFIEVCENSACTKTSPLKCQRCSGCMAASKVDDKSGVIRESNCTQCRWKWAEGTVYTRYVFDGSVLEKAGRAIEKVLQCVSLWRSKVSVTVASSKLSWSVVSTKEWYDIFEEKVAQIDNSRSTDQHRLPPVEPTQENNNPEIICVDDSSDEEEESRNQPQPMIRQRSGITSATGSPPPKQLVQATQVLPKYFEEISGAPVKPFLTAHIMETKIVLPFRVKHCKRDGAEDFKVQLLDIPSNDDTYKLVVRGRKILVEAFRLCVKNWIHQQWMKDAFQKLLMDRKRVEFSVHLPREQFLSAWKRGCIHEVSAHDTSLGLWIDFSVNRSGDFDLLVALLKPILGDQVQSPRIVVAVLKIEGAEYNSKKQWDNVQRELSGFDVATVATVEVTLVIGGHYNRDGISKANVFGEIRRFDDGSMPPPEVDVESPTEISSLNHSATKAASSSLSASERESRGRGSEQLRGTVSDANQIFKKKFRFVYDVEYQRCDINYQFVMSEMWSKHKEQFGAFCNDECGCALKVDGLTCDIVDRFIVKKQIEDKLWHVPTEWGDWRASRRSPVGFVNHFVVKFRPLLLKAYPDELPLQTLHRLHKMWELHTRYVIAICCMDASEHNAFILLSLNKLDKLTHFFDLTLQAKNVWYGMRRNLHLPIGMEGGFLPRRCSG